MLYFAELRPRCEIAFARLTVDQAIGDRRYRYGRQGVRGEEWRDRRGGGGGVAVFLTDAIRCYLRG